MGEEAREKELEVSMRVGSLVVCVDGYAGCDNVKPLIEGKTYTVRGIEKSKRSRMGFVTELESNAVMLCEIHNKSGSRVGEYGYKIERFLELCDTEF